MSSRLSESDFGGYHDERLPPVLYPGHDVRPTSRKELTGWYMYAFAAETYVICGIGKEMIYPNDIDAAFPSADGDLLPRFLHSNPPRDISA